ncbi:MAG: PAS domain-containing protein [Candidatus Abyssobacteria bacterium SURF_17]|uniref:PAS domain-containing protein n=1 Tax=Candidatus Abyssobacteria bacterium SURF_17 TaxID=2093361 RepID=A0A419EQ58_9BACT|nr:MAG: PAS domain-containing protein [Candidatus Abyssubacteria bacterium SURF_17]
MAQRELDNRFFPLIFDTISHGIFTIDADGRITSFNRTAEDLTGYSKEEVLGQPCHQIFQADFCELDCPLKRSIKTGERSEAVEVTVLRKDGRRLPIAISTAALVDADGRVMGGVEMFRDLSAVAELRKRLMGSYVFEDIVSKSPSMHRIFELIPLAANSQSHVIIEGETGTGKELVARAIHNLSVRRNKPFVAVNCAALPDQLLESELFGYKKGAFTDAKKDKPGRFTMAEGGTILLDEIGDISPAMQVKLLRVLEVKEYTPLGTNQSVKADVRVIASTNRNLAREVQKKRFRADLYFRLNVVRIVLPPLSERREDIPLLVNHFIERFNALQGRRIVRCSERVMAALMGYSFQGNVRELENAIEHAFVVCIGDTIQLEDLPSHIVAAVTESHVSAKTRLRPLDNAEAETIRTVLSKHFGNRNRAAAELGISRNTLWRKMKRYGIE